MTSQNDGGYDAGSDAIVVAASPSTRVGRIDDTLDELHQDPGVVAEVLRLDVTLVQPT